jgi:2-polyprenyl-3-methyl-5-hydroxy-6-metoxy-1,4-benzoquinol methylase
MDSIRSKYQKYGVKNFYQFNFDQYKNPHESIIYKSIIFVNDNWDVNFNKTLDLACGTGIVTTALSKLGYNYIDACDAYSCKYYQKETNKICKNISFDDIINGSLDNEKYDTIICSFALHLLEDSKMAIFLYKLTQISKQLLILSPHKRPIIKDEWGWLLQNEIIIDKVRIRLFNNIFLKHF